MGVTKQILGPEIKSLQYFLNRTAVLTQYRDLLRTTKPLTVDVRLDLRRQIRAGFDAYRNEKDEQRVRLLLQQAREQMKMVSDLVELAAARQRVPVIECDWKKDERITFTQKSVAVSTDTKDKWMDASLERSDGEEDVKGRLGTGWPWSSSKSTSILNLEGIKRR
ncbi:unnamed protein product [Peronospora belbahrii]|uniref:Complex 1 LYR protein domain-containing protein n=1 Tax=Peronospora belbahrii TaxID=622444 RepID=A0ABN8D1T1_9STRA|nr:unnamed protein product [Peronospora belbahrii]